MIGSPSKNVSGSIRNVAQNAVLFVLLWAIATIVITNFKDARFRTEMARTKGMFHDVRGALEAFSVDHHQYPSAVPLRNFTIDPSADTMKIPMSRGFDGIPISVLEKAGGLELLAVDPGLTSGSQPGLTTPVAYIKNLPADPWINYQGEKNIPFAYYVYNNPPGWILWSPGPDHDYDLQRPTEFYNPAKKLLSKKWRVLEFSMSHKDESMNGDMIWISGGADEMYKWNPD